MDGDSGADDGERKEVPRDAPDLGERCQERRDCERSRDADQQAGQHLASDAERRERHVDVLDHGQIIAGGAAAHRLDRSIEGSGRGGGGPISLT
jgi:hypothetical protein